MKHSQLVLFILLGAMYSRAQVTFVKGYIVNLKGDTLKGEAKINPKKNWKAIIRFLKTIAAFKKIINLKNCKHMATRGNILFRWMQRVKRNSIKY